MKDVRGKKATFGSRILVHDSCLSTRLLLVRRLRTLSPSLTNSQSDTYGLGVRAPSDFKTKHMTFKIAH